MTLETAAWAVAGLVLGLLQALSLWRSAREPRRACALAPLRLLSIGAALVAAAFFGGLIPAAVGWACGFPLSATGLLLRGRS